MGGPGRIENLKRKGKGRPKGALNKSTRAKDEYFKLFFQMGGIKELKKLLKESKRDRSKFLLDTLPSLMPKKTEIKADVNEGGIGRALTPIELSAKIVYLVKLAAERKQLEEKSDSKAELEEE
jgi:hypothetical protein